MGAEPKKLEQEYARKGGKFSAQPLCSSGCKFVGMHLQTRHVGNDKKYVQPRSWLDAERRGCHNREVQKHQRTAIPELQA